MDREDFYRRHILLSWEDHYKIAMERMPARHKIKYNSLLRMRRETLRGIRAICEERGILWASSPFERFFEAMNMEETLLCDAMYLLGAEHMESDILSATAQAVMVQETNGAISPAVQSEEAWD